MEQVQCAVLASYKVSEIETDLACLTIGYPRKNKGKMGLILKRNGVVSPKDQYYRFKDLELVSLRLYCYYSSLSSWQPDNILLNISLWICLLKTWQCLLQFLETVHKKSDLCKMNMVLVASCLVFWSVTAVLVAYYWIPVNTFCLIHILRDEYWWKPLSSLTEHPYSRQTWRDRTAYLPTVPLKCH